jgi:uncharacterized cupin superfamily protein
MPFTTLTLGSLEGRPFEPLTELPPFAELLPGSRISIAHLAGPVAAAGEIAAMRIEIGGFRYRDIPAAESGFLLTGSAVVRDDDNEATLGAGEGYWLAPGWTGTFEALTPVTKVFYLL